MKFADCQVGMKVKTNPENIGAYSKWFKPENEYVIVGCTADELLELVGDDGETHLILPKRFDPAVPAIVYDETMFYVGDIVKRVGAFPSKILGEGELRIISVRNGGGEAKFIKRDGQGAITVERLDGVPGADAKRWNAHRFTFIRHAGVLPNKVDGVFEVGDEVVHLPTGGKKIYIISEVFNETRNFTLKGMPGTKFSFDDFKHADVPAAKPVPPKPAEPVWPELDEALMDDLTQKSAGGVCNFALKTVDGVKFYKIQAACHASLGSYGVDTQKKIHTLACNVSSHYKNMDVNTKKNYTLHTEYIIKESPWAKYFHDRPIEKVLEGGVFMDVSNVHSHVVTACIALRMGHEHSAAVKMNVFARAIHLGYNKHIAFIVAHTTVLEGGKVVPWKNGGWHHCINSDHNVEELCKFFQVGYTRGMDKKHTKDGLYTYNVQDTVAPSNGVTVHQNYLNAKGAKVKKGKWGEDEVEVVGDFDSSLASLCETLVPFFK